VEQNEVKRQSVLVVEDEPGIAAVCMRILSREGFQVDIAANGEVALEMWRRKNYDLCLSDIRTPRMNGIELYRQLEIERPEAIKTFIFTTGDTMSVNIKTFLEETGRPYLAKPFAPDNLRAIIKTVFIAT
jgi:DNA-binding response OmpR family regulator